MSHERSGDGFVEVLAFLKKKVCTTARVIAASLVAYQFKH